jgi:hypothetical protein
MIALFSKPNIFPLYAATQLAFSADSIQKAAQSITSIKNCPYKMVFIWDDDKKLLGRCREIFLLTGKSRKSLVGLGLHWEYV